MRFSTGTAFLISGALAGYVSAQQSLGRAGLVPVANELRWQQARVNPKDPYTVYAIGHFSADGFLPPPATSLFYLRNTDEDGNTLRAECAYTFAGAAPQSRWWSVRIGNSLDAVTTLTAGDAILSGDDQLKIGIARRPTPGNWLAMPQVSNLQVTLVMNEPYPLAKNAKTTPLPTVQKVECE